MVQTTNQNHGGSNQYQSPVQQKVVISRPRNGNTPQDNSKNFKQGQNIVIVRGNGQQGKCLQIFNRLKFLTEFRFLLEGFLSQEPVFYLKSTLPIYFYRIWTKIKESKKMKSPEN
jgi:hypothetical protein